MEDKKTQFQARTTCQNGGGILYEPMSNNFTNDTDYNQLMEIFQAKMNKQAITLLGMADQYDDNDSNFNWFNSSSQTTVCDFSDFNWDVTNSNQRRLGEGHRVYVKANNQQWFVTECEEENTHNLMTKLQTDMNMKGSYNSIMRGKALVLEKLVSFTTC